MAETNNAGQKFMLVIVRILIFIWYIGWDLLASGFLTAPLLIKVDGRGTAIFVVMGLLLYWWFVRSILKRIRKVRPDFKIERLNWRNWRKALIMVALLLVVFGWNGLWSFLSQWLFPHLAGTTTANEATLDELGSSNGVYSQLLLAVYACLVAPIVEELIFRGMFFTYFDRFKNWWIAPILSAACFAAFHVGGFTPKDLIDFAAYFPIGILLAYLYKSSGRISNSMFMHGLNNTVATLLGWLALIAK